METAPMRDVTDAKRADDQVPPAAPSGFDRRTLIRRGAALSAGLAATGTLVRLGLAQENPATPETASRSSADATPSIVEAANIFLDRLSDDQRDAALFGFDDTAQRQRWSNLPEGLFERAGLMWGDLDEEVREAWLGLMQATMSEEGYNRVIAEWNADEALTSGKRWRRTGRRTTPVRHAVLLGRGHRRAVRDRTLAVAVGRPPRHCQRHDRRRERRAHSELHRRPARYVHRCERK